MSHRILLRAIASVLVSAALSPLIAADPVPLDTAAIEQATGLEGALDQREGVFKVSAPRADLPVSVDGRALPPFMGLTSWAAFMRGGSAEAMVMGDLVLFQDEVTPAMDALFAAGLSVTALHNHFLFEEPRVFFMHIGGEGTAVGLAKGVRSALDAIASVRAKAPRPVIASRAASLPGKSAIDPAPLEEILGVDLQAKDGMAKAVIGRTARMACGCTAGKEMGVNTWAAFMGDAEHAIVAGDFATVAGELQPVLKALRAGGIDIVAIHHHMEGDTPHYLFLHYWGAGRAADLARTLRAALDAQGRVAQAQP